jgi:hypothetical protein
MGARKINTFALQILRVVAIIIAIGIIIFFSFMHLPFRVPFILVVLLTKVVCNVFAQIVVVYDAFRLTQVRLLRK